jgi:hypothetical protein
MTVPGLDVQADSRRFRRNQRKWQVLLITARLQTAHDSYSHFTTAAASMR